LNGSQTWTTAGGATLTVGGAISGPYGLTFPGAGTTVLSGTDSYSGGTNILAGTLAIGLTNALPATGTVTIGNSNGVGSGAFRLSSFSQTLTSLTAQSNNTAGTLDTVNIGSVATLTINGGLTVGLDLSSTQGIAITSYMNMSGGGVLDVNTSSANLVVSLAQSTPLSSGNFATLDLSGLSRFIFGNSPTGTNILGVGY
jgi:fibronectin-binding autotransporter adhesin